MRRVVDPELLDSDAGTAAEIADSLSDLRWLNRYFGGNNTTTDLLRRIAQARQLRKLTFLDIAGASGDNAQSAQEELRREGIDLQITLLDRAESHFQHTAAGVGKVVGDALAIPFRDNSFDVTGSSLFLHHLEPDAIDTFLRESLRVCRYAVLVNDLIRDPLHLGLAYAGIPLYRSRLTRHDAPVSVRRAYTVEEVTGSARRSGAVGIEVSRHFLYRMGLILWKPERA